MRNRPVSYEQTDKRWCGEMYSSTGNKRQTIGTSGCGPTCAAMVIATLRDVNVTPSSCCRWAVANGYRTANDGTSWDYFPAQLAEFGIDCEYTWSKEGVIAALRAGKMVICSMGKGLWTSSGHIILAYGIEDGMILVNDPNSQAQKREKAPIATWMNDVGACWIIQEEWKMERKSIRIQVVSDGVQEVKEVEGLFIDGINYIPLRAMEGLAPVSVCYDEQSRLPTVTVHSLGDGEAAIRAFQESLLNAYKRGAI